MQLLKIKPATQLVNGQKVPCYGIYCGYELMRTVSVFEYDETRTMIKAANAVINHQAKAVVDQAKRKAAAKRALIICGQLTESRARLTKKTISAANLAADWSTDSERLRIGAMACANAPVQQEPEFTLCQDRFEEDFQREFGAGDEQQERPVRTDQDMIDAGHKWSDFK